MASLSAFFSGVSASASLSATATFGGPRGLGLGVVAPDPVAGASLVMSAAAPSPEPFFVPFFLISLGLRLSRIERDVDPVKQHIMRNNANFLQETMIVFVYSKCPSTDAEQKGGEAK